MRTYRRTGRLAALAACATLALAGCGSGGSIDEQTKALQAMLGARREAETRLADLEATSRLIAAFCRDVSAEDDWTP